MVQLLQRLLILVAVGTRVEMARPLPDDRTRDCHHLGIEIPLGAAELWCPNFACGAQCEQRHPGAARLDNDHPLAPAEGEAPEVQKDDVPTATIRVASPIETGTATTRCSERQRRRRSQKGGFTWERMTKLVADWLPPPRILHPWPDERFDVRHPR